MNTSKTMAWFCYFLLFAVIILTTSILLIEPEVKIIEVENPCDCPIDAMKEENDLLKSKLDKMNDDYQKCLEREVHRIVKIH